MRACRSLIAASCSSLVAGGTALGSSARQYTRVRLLMNTVSAAQRKGAGRGARGERGEGVCKFRSACKAGGEAAAWNSRCVPCAVTACA